MYRKIHALFLSCAIMLAMVAGVGAKPSRASASPAVTGGQLLSVLPASDFLMYVDTQRLLTDAVPTFLATKPEILAKMNEGLDRMRTDTGIDPRSFDTLAVGIRHNASVANNVNMVILARGRFDAGSVINAGFASAAKEKNGFQQPKQEEYKGKTLYVLAGPSALVVGPYMVGKNNTTASSSPASSANNGPGSKAPGPARSAVPRAATPGKSKPAIAAAPCPPGAPCALKTVQEKQDVERRAGEKTVVAALDSNTIALGDLENVRATIDAESGGERVDDELVQLATRNTSALVGFSGRQPSFFMQRPGRKADSQDPLANSLEEIQQFYGSFSMSGTDMETILNLRMETPEQARAIKEMLDMFKPAESDAAQSSTPLGIAHLLKALTLNTEGNEVQIQIKLTQADLMHLLPRL
ncbi:MAG TPA: hypothetical protein VGO91_01430 [Pyrinomonadaceae bacterium]|jgi:hypothetical protein|nr:hypothetical protein [Pyrinomonadaceae bacterium]